MATARAYTLGTIPEDQKFRGQAALIVDFMKAEARPVTVAETVAAIEKDLTTRQDPTRVVSFYMSVWKKRGWVRVSEVEVAEPQADATDEPMNRSEEGLDVTPEEHVAAQLEADVEATHIEAENLGETEGQEFAESGMGSNEGRRSRKNRRR